MSKGKAWSVPVKVNGFEISAIVDTAAESTLISNRLHESLSPKPDVRRKLKLKTADGKSMSAEILEPLTLEVGELKVEHEVLKGDLSDEMLLGMDFLREVDASLQCGRGILTIGGQRIPRSMRHYNVAEASLP
jgi:predicted aspartyl protease